MDEKIKRIFHKHFDDECALAERHPRCVEYSYSQELLIDVYADICGISYDAAAAELHAITARRDEQ